MSSLKQNVLFPIFFNWNVIESKLRKIELFAYTSVYQFSLTKIMLLLLLLFVFSLLRVCIIILFSPDCAPVLLQLLTMVIYCLYCIQTQDSNYFETNKQKRAILLRVTCYTILSLYLFYFIKAGIVSFIEIMFPCYLYVHNISVYELTTELSVTKRPGARI